MSFPATGKAIGEPMKHHDEVVSARFSPDGQRIVTASWDTARVWDVATVVVKDPAAWPNGRSLLVVLQSDPQGRFPKSGQCTTARSGVANFRRVFATCGTVGTRSRAIRGSTSDDRVGCSASDGRCTPARPRSMSRRVFCRFCHARSRVPMVFDPFHYCAF